MRFQRFIAIRPLILFASVFALFRTDVTVVDEAKKAELSKLLTESVMTTAPGGKLDNKLAALTLTADSGERAYLLLCTSIIWLLSLIFGSAAAELRRKCLVGSSGYVVVFSSLGTL